MSREIHAYVHVYACIYVHMHTRSVCVCVCMAMWLELLSQHKGIHGGMKEGNVIHSTLTSLVVSMRTQRHRERGSTCRRRRGEGGEETHVRVSIDTRRGGAQRN